jgi:hypothetical protein
MPPTIAPGPEPGKSPSPPRGRILECPTRDWTAAFRESVIRAWEQPLTELFTRTGLDAEPARTHARLGLAVTRGLGLDLLMTGERAQVEAAMELFATMIRNELVR